MQKAVDLAKAEMEEEQNGLSRKAYMTVILRGLAIDLADPNFKDTPGRFLRYLEHYLQPYDPAGDLGVTFPLKAKEGDFDGEYDSAMVVQGPIPYRAVCAHHLLPVIGVAHVAYLPRQNVVGLSKLSRLVYGITHRSPSLQEDVGHEIARALTSHLKPLGAVCMIKAEHGCMAARGVEEVGIHTTTTALEGVFRKDAAARREFYSMIRS